METYFQEQFQRISLSPEVMEALCDGRVTRFLLHKKERVLEFGLEFSHVVEEKQIFSLKEQLMERLPLKDVLITLRYACPMLSTEQAIAAEWENILLRVEEEGPACGMILRQATWKLQDGALEVTLPHHAASLFYRRGIDRVIQQKLDRQFGLALSVRFVDQVTTAEEEAARRKKREEDAAALLSACLQEKKQQEQEKADAARTKASAQVENGILLGREIMGSPVPISQTRTEGEKVIIEGRVFGAESREIKGGRYIVSFDITDLTDSTTVKFFVDKAVYDAELAGYFKTGKYVKVKGEVQYDTYAKEIVIMSRDISVGTPPPKRQDLAPVKRVELHLHTQMSRMDAITPAKEYVARALEWGHPAIAITDHGVVQAFPEAMEAAKGKEIKILYGVEGYLINDLGNAVLCPRGQSIDDTYVVFDLETTGLSREKDRITEIGAVKVMGGKIVDRFSTFVNPEMPISAEITKLTGIDDAMVADAPVIGEILPQFLDFVSDAVLVAHNAAFDTGFIRKNGERLGLKPLENTVVDTVELAKSLLPQLSKFKLDVVCDALGVDLRGHHRAVNDAEATAEVFLKFLQMLAEKEVYDLDHINAFCSRTIHYDKLRPYHIILLVKNYVGLRNLYDLVSMSNLEYFAKKRPRIPKSKLMEKREGLIIGSACEAGELYQALLDDKSQEMIDDIAGFYDYLEIQPVANNKFMIASPKVDAVHSVADIQNLNRRLVALGDKLKKPVVATCDCHFIDPEGADYRKIILNAEGFSDVETKTPLYFRTTEEMLDEFRYLGEEKAYEVVVTNTNLVASWIESIKPIPDGTFPPRIDGADEDLRNITTKKAHELYGDPLPEVVEKRLERELNSIISNGYAVLYIIAQKLVWNSVEHGYLVGSRGSVGSSFAATMAGITEVNPLPPHYLCPNCKYSDFDSEVVRQTYLEGGSGCDMPDAVCPVCGSPLHKEGHDIPFETFLGFNGDKEPDIDLNFSGEYQQQAHAYTEVLFGKGKVFKAGTIGTLADKTAYGFVMKYLEEHNKTAHPAEIRRLAAGCTGVKRTTGQHPGGLMVVPRDHDICEFCPVQHPADDVNSTIITTHFDYHSISGRLLKLDLLGHDDPTVIRMLYDLTGVNPQSVPLDDKETMSLFESPKALGVTGEQIGCETGTLGIPEFGTKFVRQMLLDTKPKTFSDLLRISGLSHGTDVWINNAADLIANGTITLKETISTRDSIMGYLITKGVPNKDSFRIMEKVRKGKGLTEEHIALMKEHDVPQWYIDSCQKIKYMFPKAHAAAYVMMAFRIAYFKIRYPLAYYASYFSVRACDDFDYDCMCRGEEVARAAAKELYDKGNSATAKEKNKLTVLELVIEFYARGFTFYPIDLYRSDATKFIPEKDGLIPPFNSLQGLGVTAAQGIVDGRAGVTEFKTQEEFREKTGLGKTLMELLQANGVLRGLPETSQLSLFM